MRRLFVAKRIKVEQRDTQGRAEGECLVTA